MNYDVLAQVSSAKLSSLNSQKIFIQLNNQLKTCKKSQNQEKVHLSTKLSLLVIMLPDKESFLMGKRSMFGAIFSVIIR